jgi:hypothetical protein
MKMPVHHFFAVAALEAPTATWREALRLAQEQWATEGSVHITVRFLPPANESLQFLQTLRRRFAQYCKGEASLRLRCRKRKDGSVSVLLDIVPVLVPV